jgi:pilus assembly protein CpaB
MPGDHVDVMLMRDLSTDKEDRRLVTDVVLQNVRLLGVDLNADPSSATPAAPRNATLEVSMEDAQKLSMASDLGSLSLALRRQGADQTEIMRPILATELGIVGAHVRRSAPSAPALQPAVQMAPAAPAARRPASPDPVAPRPTRGRTGVIVVHGDSSTVTEVPTDLRAGA